MRKRRTEEQIESLVREVQADIKAGLKVEQALRKVGIGQATYYRWKNRLEVPVAPVERRVLELESEVDRLKLLVAELAMDRHMLQEALKKKP
jgi:putative transposase